MPRASFDRPTRASRHDPPRISPSTPERNPVPVAEHFRQIARDIVAYGALAAVSRASGLILLPLLTRHFSLQDYGLIDLYSVSVSFAAIFIRMALPSAINRYYHDRTHHGTGDASHKAMIGTCLALVVGAGSTLSAVALALNHAWPLVHISPQLTTEVLYLGLASASLLAVASVCEAVLRAKREILHTNLINFLNTAVFLSLALWWITGDAAGIVPVFRAQFFGALGAAGLGLWLVRQEIALRFERGLARSVLRFSLPLVPAILVNWANEQADRWILLWLSGLGSVAIYAAAAKIAVLFQFGTTMFRQAWRPYSMTLLDAEDRDEIYRAVLEAYMAAFAILGMVFIACVPEIFFIFVPEAYAAGIPLIPWLVGAALLHHSISMTNLGLIVSQRTSRIGIASAFSVALNIIISIPLIIAVGIQGAAIGAFIAVLTLSALLLRDSNKTAQTQFAWTTLLGPTAVYLAVSLMAIELSAIEPTWLSIAARGTLVLAGAAFIYRRFVRGETRIALWALLPSTSR